MRALFHFFQVIEMRQLTNFSISMKKKIFFFIISLFRSLASKKKVKRVRLLTDFTR